MHQLTFIRQQVTSHIPAVRGFFASLFSLFTQSPKRTSILDQTVARRLPRASSTWWNFSSGIVSAVYGNLDDLIRCFESIRTSGSFGSITLREASGFLKMLRDRDFNHVDILYRQLQKKDSDAAFAECVLQSFTNSVQAIGSHQIMLISSSRRNKMHAFNAHNDSKKLMPLHRLNLWPWLETWFAQCIRLRKQLN